MSLIEYIDSAEQKWETVTEGSRKNSTYDAKPGENRVLLRIAAGKGYPKHGHSVPDEVFVMEGIYVDPHVEGGKEFGPGSYLYYPAGTEHNATTLPDVPYLSGMRMFLNDFCGRMHRKVRVPFQFPKGISQHNTYPPPISHKFSCTGLYW
jgi:quercetin dioxygenase-like cupin family protein